MNNQEHIPEKIRAAGKKLPFKAPDSYFDTLPEKIQDRMAEKRRPAMHIIRPKFAIAAMIIALITLGYAGFRILTEQDKTPYLSNDELTETIEYFAYELDEEMLISALIESDIDFSSESPDLQGDEIIQYLSEEDIDISDLMID